jgi:O-antigen/teichoic acid export membrane protein
LITPLLIRWYGSHEFVLPYLILLITIPASGLTGVPMAKLERELDFRRIAAIELSGQVLGLIAAVALAWAKAGVWAPVAGQLVWQIFTLAATSRASRLKLGLRLHSEHWRPMCRFGVGMTLSLRTWQLRTLVNPILVGRLAGTEAVAFVALAIRIAEALGTFRLAAGRMAIAALARLQDRKDNFQSALKSALFLQVITLGPLLCAFALAGPFLLRHVIGSKWAPSLVIYPFIAAGVLVNSIFNLQASALFVLEQHWTVMRSYIAHVALLGGGTWLLFPRWGILGYGWAELAACLAYYFIHRRLRNEFRISIGNIALLAGAFTALLFLPRFLAFIFPHASA